MDFAFSEEQEMLRTSAREFLAKQCPSPYVRRMMEAEDAWDPAFWARLAEMGWTGLGIPEEYGGVGTFLDLVVVLEEADRKSTRLNSSHVAISYAVFCLKK